jgi:ferrous iron transport protein B
MKIHEQGDLPRIVLVGQPNCGKSTIFNKVAGYRSVSTNFPGATVEFTQSKVEINTQTCQLVDLPGIYSLTSLDAATEESKRFLLTEHVDVIVNIVDASLLSRSLELTLQLMELGTPMVLCLNMIDEAERKGVIIDTEKLSSQLQIPVVSTIGVKGQGVPELFEQSFATIRDEVAPPPSLPMTDHVEQSIQTLSAYLKMHLESPPFGHRLTAIKLLEGDPFFTDTLPSNNSPVEPVLEQCQSALEKAHGQPADAVISSERHSLSMNIFEQVATVQQSRHSRRDRIDSVIMHPVAGYIIMLMVLYGLFNLVFSLGAMVEEPILSFFNVHINILSHYFGQDTLVFHMVKGVVQGISGGIAIVLPYLLPFLLALALIEDLGYLPRVAFLMDNFMHKIGLHGTAVIPGILGYGCSVPAVMATRILSSPRDRFISSVVAILIPCSARMVVIFGLVGFYLGGTAALGVYLLNIVVISITGSILSRLLPEDTPGMILEIPAYQLPSLKVVWSKTWLRMREFIVIAWPLLVVGSLVLSVAEWFHFQSVINSLVRPVTFILDLPTEVGSTLLFGILRKELSMLMLMQALGTQDVATVMTNTQLLVFTLFVVFYIPCVATIGILAKEIGWKRTAAAILITIILAIVIALLGRLVGMLVYG